MDKDKIKTAAAGRFATVGEARSLESLPKSGVYEIRELLPLAKETLRKKGKKKEISDAEAIIYLRDKGYKFVERAVID